MSQDLRPGADGKLRPAWALTGKLEQDYYDNEWGVPVHDETGLFERISLECFQSGLSWSTILRKRPAFRAAFAGFVPDVVAGFGDDDVTRLLADEGIVRNRRKIEATIHNARATLQLREQEGLAALIWSFQPAPRPRPRSLAEIGAQSPESVALARELKRRGFVFVGPTTMYALMQAVGMVDDHLAGTWR